MSTGEASSDAQTAPSGIETHTNTAKALAIWLRMTRHFGTGEELTDEQYHTTSRQTITWLHKVTKSSPTSNRQVEQAMLFVRSLER